MKSSLPMYACTWVRERTHTPYLHQGVREDTWGLWDKGRRMGKGEAPGVTERESLTSTVRWV